MVQVRQRHAAEQRVPLTVASSIFLARHESLRVEETPVGTIPDLVDDIGLEVDVKRPRHVLARGGLREEGAEAIIVVGGRGIDKTTIGLTISSVPYSSMGYCDWHSHQDRARRCKVPLQAHPIIRQSHRTQTRAETREFEMTRQSHQRMRIALGMWGKWGCQLTAGVTDLDTSLTNVYGDDFTHLFKETGRTS